VLTKVGSFIHKWQHIGDAGSAVGGHANLIGSVGRQGGMVSAGQPGWQSLQQGSVQEEGEVAGAGDAIDTTSRMVHGETEEDLLQGLLAEEGAATLTGLQAVAADAVNKVGGEGDAIMLDEGELVFMEDYEEAYEQGYKEASDAGEASAASEEAGGGAAEVASATSGTEQALLARHSLYRLVLRSSALEAHFHVKVFLAYPLCPPVFAATRLLDIRDVRAGSSKGSVALSAVNEVLRLEQQVGGSMISR
jgi:hypothetical protein